MGKTETMRLIWLPTGGHIGDAVMVTSLFAEALERNSDLTITYVVRRNAGLIAELTEAYPRIDVVAVPRSVIGAFKFVLPLLKERSIVVAPPAWDVHPLLIKLLALLFRVRGDTVVGFADGTSFQPWDIRVVYDKHTELYIDGLRAALRAVALTVAESHAPPSLTLTTHVPADFPYAGKPYVVVHAFPHMAKFKTIPLRRWKDLLAWLHETYPDYGLVITGAEVDRAEAEELLAVTGDRGYLAIGKPLMEVAGLIEHARLYIGVDTGPTHIAGVLGAPSVVLAHLNEPTWLPTYNPNALLLSNRARCVCKVPEETCFVEEEGETYRRCVYYIPDTEIQGAIRLKLDDSA